ncbi:DNA repair protein RAD50-like [Anopheles ziemanni]|uniref:DNA repair protein RAD50-like n=1 Tax=Anopheles coustani TaxID=139045 RepID=UPI002657C87F|nr:DNA repair protein RAD50-like [Anopheles coustani]XP_058174895.1 DNA repair protein RAD50-like [Anopheles ziemanni]
MSTVSKLEIRGIRSFGVDSGDVQKINFRSPLTLIVGQNGCGKTTVIECLKFGLTGEVPPGTNRGIGFVHDPKIFNTVESLGQVKLMVKDVTGNSVTAIRSMKITHKGANPKFETLDSTITMENAQTNTKTTMTRSRAADLNNDMCDAMGVSKAILNNVIFCHQEDSNWPLEEPKELKKRFDAIFGTTEYNVAIDKLIKMSKAYTERQKEKLGDLKLLQHIKEQADAKQLQLGSGEQKLSKLRQTVTDLDSDIEPIQKKLEKLALVEREYSSLMAKKIEFSSKIKGKHEQQRQLKSKISLLFEGSLEELQAEIVLFQQTFASKRSDLDMEESALQTLRSQEKSLQGKLQSMDGQNIELLEKQKRERELQADRGKKIATLGEKLKLQLKDDYGGANLDAALRSVRDALRKEETNVQTMGKTFDEEDVKAQKAIDKLRETKASLENECQSKRRQMEQIGKEKQRTANELVEIERSAETLKRLIEEIDRLEREYEVYSKATDLPAMKKELSVKKELRDKLQDQLDRLDERVTTLNEFAVKDRELTLKEQQYTGRESDLRKLKNKHADSLRRLFPDRTIESNYKRNMQDLYDTLQKDIKTMNEKIRRTQATVTEMETTRKSQKQQLERLERDLADAEEKVYAACRGNPYEDVVAKLNDKINKNNLEHGEARSAVVLYQKFISNIENDRCCPVCDKEMGGDDAQEISGKLSDEIRRLPEKIETLERTLKKDRLEYDRLLALKPVSERLEKQKEELPRLKQQLQETERRLTTASDELEEHLLAISEPTGNVQLISTIVGDMSLLDETSKDLERMKRGVEELKAELANKVPEGVTIESLKAERDSLREKLKTERRSVDELQTTIDSKTEKLNNLQSRNNQMKTKKLKLQESVQTLEQKRTKIRELEEQTTTLESELRAAEQRLQPVKEQLTKEQEQKQRTKELNGQKLQKARKTLEALNWEETEIIRLGCELDELAVLNLTTELNRLKGKIDQVKTERERIVASIEPKTKNIEKLKQDIANQQLRERDLQDNRDLKRLMRETSVMESELETLMKGMGEMEVGNVQKERNRLLDLRDGLQAKRSELNGQIGELVRQLNDLRKELTKSEFQNALRNYKKTLYESVVLKKISSDIKKYRDALEWALREYHTEMMKTINQSIYSLWRDIYRGNDIDYIRINTEDDESAERTERRRVYSYRVVQAKNDVEIDMRGRCSAGQKVLASLIIRLALAEAFCSKCGVMALDEPTTNLDRDNIESLCESLRDIVTERQYGNFLLIVITHDEEFVTKLEKFDTYYRISRNAEGKSVIKEEQL